MSDNKTKTTTNVEDVNPSKLKKEQGTFGVRRWHVTLLRPVPTSFSLDQRAGGLKLIEKSANFISQAIDEHLRINSICAKFDTANAEVTCKTNSAIEFQIFLYSGPGKGSTYIEVLKIRGCGFEFMKHRENIINAAIGKTLVLSKQEEPKKLSTSTVYGNITQLKIPPTFINSYTPPTKGDVQSMVDRASNRLGQSKSLEDTIFILQNLMSLTSPTNDINYPSYAHWISLLTMENLKNIRDMILSIYKKHTH